MADEKQPDLPSFCTEQWFRDNICSKHGIQSRDHINLTISGQDALTGGYLSYITRLHLRWSNSGAELPTSVIVKVVTVDKIAFEMEKNIGPEQAAKTVAIFEKNLKAIHNNECYIYESFLAGIGSAVPHPTAYVVQRLGYSDPNGLLVLSDISKVAGCIPVQDGFSLTQINQLVELVAIMQAYGIENEEWRSQLNPMNREVWVELGKSVQPMFEVVKAKFPEMYNGIEVSDIHPFKDVDRYMKLCVDGPFEHSVFVHGDLWTNNIMMTKTDDGKFTDQISAVIDWQDCHIGQPGEDLARIMVGHMTPEDRRINQWNILDHYYETLGRKLGHSPPFTIDYVRNCYKNSISLVIGTTILLHGMMYETLTDKENQRLGERAVELIKDAINGHY